MKRQKKVSKGIIKETKKTKNSIAIEELHKEIDLIQACITRMADNSFRLKELYVSLVVIALTVMMSQEYILSIIGLFLFFVTIVFWGLDAFFLKMETLYRWKYEWVIKKREKGIREHLYDLNPHNKDMWLNMKNKKECFMKFVFSKTLVPLYGIVAVVAIIMLIIAVINKGENIYVYWIQFTT